MRSRPGSLKMMLRLLTMGNRRGLELRVNVKILMDRPFLQSMALKFIFIPHFSTI